jgi:hypothetical protein
MNLRRTFVAGCLFALCVSLYSQTDETTTPPKPEKTSVTRLDGTKLFGLVEITDDYSQNDGQSNKNAKSEGGSAVEIRLGEIAAFQPVIAAYEKTLGSKKSDKAASTKASGEKSETSDTPFTPLFSQPGMAGGLAEPFTGFGTSALQPITGAASSATSATGLIQSAAGAATSLPSAPQ